MKAGLAFLKRKSSLKDEGPMAFVKANLSSFMDCYETLAGQYDCGDSVVTLWSLCGDSVVTLWSLCGHSVVSGP